MRAHAHVPRIRPRPGRRGERLDRALHQAFLREERLGAADQGLDEGLRALGAVAPAPRRDAPDRFQRRVERAEVPAASLLGDVEAHVPAVVAAFVGAEEVFAAGQADAGFHVLLGGGAGAVVDVEVGVVEEVRLVAHGHQVGEAVELAGEATVGRGEGAYQEDAVEEEEDHDSDVRGKRELEVDSLAVICGRRDQECSHEYGEQW